MSKGVTSVAPLQGVQLFIAAALLAMANFIVVLDMTIANVLVPHIAGNLGATSSEGTYVITSYAVAEAIIVPLTGWLTIRYGMVRTFVTSIILFGVFSALCGFAHSLGFLVIARILQGLAGGPIMPLSQTLLMNIFPKEKHGIAMAIWSVTTLIAPILGPIVGGYVAEIWSWRWAFILNIPFVVICSFFTIILLKKFESERIKKKIDAVGFGLLLVFVSALQLMLDEGDKLCWFESSFISTLAVIAFIGFIAFLIWEIYEPDPIVDLSVFKSRGFSFSVLTISVVFSSFFATMVLTPLWLQTSMGYTAVWAGWALASNGILAVFLAPIVAQSMTRVDPRKIVIIGVLWIALVTLYRSFGTQDMTFWDVSIPILIQGAAMPLFFIPLMTLALSSVEPSQMASAAGMMSFLRTLSGAFGTSTVVTIWGNLTKANRVELVSILPNHESLSLPLLEAVVETQSVMLATNQVLFFASIVFVLGAFVAWLIPKPTQLVQGGGGH